MAPGSGSVWICYHARRGFAITHVVTLTAALAVLKEQVFDLMALDLGLPDSQGLVTLQKMRAMISDIRLWC